MARMRERVSKRKLLRRKKRQTMVIKNDATETVSKTLNVINELFSWRTISQAVVAQFKHTWKIRVFGEHMSSYIRAAIVTLCVVCICVGHKVNQRPQYNKYCKVNVRKIEKILYAQCTHNCLLNVSNGSEEVAMPMLRATNDFSYFVALVPSLAILFLF